jgi:hypothetical protein
VGIVATCGGGKKEGVNGQWGEGRRNSGREDVEQGGGHGSGEARVRMVKSERGRR